MANDPMKKIHTSTIIACLLLGSGYARAQDFEGHFVQRITTVAAEDLYTLLGDAMYGEDAADLSSSLIDLDVSELATMPSAEVENIRVLVRGDFTRVQPEADSDAQGYQIINTRTGTMWMVNVPEKTYFEFSKQSADEIEARTRKMMDEMGVDPDQMDDMEAHEVATGDMESTGRTAQVNGYRADAYTYYDEEQVEVAWCADDDSDFFAAMKQRALEGAFAEDDDEATETLECPDGTFPVRTLSYDVYGQELVVDDLTEIKAESLPASMFEVPGGFEKKDFMGEFLDR